MGSVRELTGARTGCVARAHSTAGRPAVQGPVEAPSLGRTAKRRATLL